MLRIQHIHLALSLALNVKDCLGNLMIVFNFRLAANNLRCVSTGLKHKNRETYLFARLLPCILYRVTKHFESNIQVLSEVLNQVISPAFIEVPLNLWGPWLQFGLRVDNWCLGCMGAVLLKGCRGGF